MARIYSQQKTRQRTRTPNLAKKCFRMELGRIHERDFTTSGKDNRPARKLQRKLVVAVDNLALLREIFTGDPGVIRSQQPLDREEMASFEVRQLCIAAKQRNVVPVGPRKSPNLGE